jgi:hypothetical protein
MSDNGGYLKLYMFVLVFSMMFPTFTYAFTTFGAEAELYDVTLDPESLILAGITLQESQLHNLTFDGAQKYYEIQAENRTIRAAWHDEFFNWATTQNWGDGIVFQVQGPLDRYLDTWYVPQKIWIESVRSGNHWQLLPNASIVQEWDNEYNWSRFKLESGYMVFIEPFYRTSNISQAVYVDGILNVTVAKGIVEGESEINLANFVNWYWGLIVGLDRYGLPAAFSWILRIIAAIQVLAGILLAKELISL